MGGEFPECRGLIVSYCLPFFLPLFYCLASFVVPLALHMHLLIVLLSLPCLAFDLVLFASGLVSYPTSLLALPLALPYPLHRLAPCLASCLSSFLPCLLACLSSCLSPLAFRLAPCFVLPLKLAFSAPCFASFPSGPASLPCVLLWPLCLLVAFALHLAWPSALQCFLAGLASCTAWPLALCLASTLLPFLAFHIAF